MKGFAHLYNASTSISEKSLVYLRIRRGWGTSLKTNSSPLNRKMMRYERGVWRGGGGVDLCDDDDGEWQMKREREKNGGGRSRTQTVNNE